jgi:hypothetical protein
MNRCIENLKKHGIGPLEVEILFRSELSLEQIEHISKLLKLLGKYMVLDRDMLTERAGEGIGLSYINKATDYTLIRQLQAKDERGKDYFVYTLVPGGIYALEAQRIAFHKLPLFTDQYDMIRILTFNKYALKHGYSISMQYPQRKEFDFFMASKKERRIVCYFPYLTDEEKIKDILLKDYDEKVVSKLEFEAITIPQVKINGGFSPYYGPNSLKKET